MCEFCRRDVEPYHAYRRVSGWERKASASSSRKGGSDVTLRRAFDEYACPECIARLRAGLDVNQESLL